MKANHRDGTRKKWRGYRDRTAFSKALKSEARVNRRLTDRRACEDFRTGRRDPEEAIVPTRNVEVSNGRNWD